MKLPMEVARSCKSIIQAFSGCLLVFSAVLFIPVDTPTTIDQAEMSPSWLESTPEDQGMDSGKLAGMLEQVQKDGRNIHSILIARHGRLVLSAYYPPFNRETAHDLYSCTKSITSALIGIALQKGLIQDLDTPVYTLFPAVTMDSSEKENITIRHLLTMSSGLEWSEPLRSGLSDNWSFIEADSPPQYFFDRVLASQPGKVFNYNTGGSHLLSMIIQDASGEKTSEFASTYLFNPLGINDFTWKSDPKKYSTGGSGLALRSEDMLKIGQLFLQRGRWDDRQILTDTWVRESSASKITIAPDIDYGYQWWVRPDGTYNALGWGGQQIIVVPRQDLVIVFTAGIRDAGWNTYDDLLKTHILPSIRSDSKIAVNKQGQAKLQEQLETIANPAPVSTAPLPDTIDQINGREYVDLNGTHGWSTFTFHFNGTDEAEMDLTYGDKSEEIKAFIGLDGLFRITDTENYGPVAFKGFWKDASTFVLTQQFLREAERLIMTLTFTEEGINRQTEWSVEDHSEDSEAVPLH